MTEPTETWSTFQGRPLTVYVVGLLVGFGLLYWLTRSTILIGDSRAYIDVARLGNPAELHYGEPSHFLQGPLARAIWRGAGALGLPIGLLPIFVGLSLCGTLAAIVFIGLVAGEILRSRAAVWLAALLFGTSLNIWTQWNGELYGLPLGLITAGLFFTLRGRIVLPAVLWGLAVLSHSEFALAAPAFVVAVWMVQPGAATPRQPLRRVALLIVLGGVTTLSVLLLGSLALGKWSDGASLASWLWRSYAARQPDVGGAEVGRALKGLLTAYTVAGHYWRDILTGRGATGNPMFVLAAAIGLVVLVLTGIMIAMAARRPRLLLFALAWLLPVHVIINWFFVPTVEKYHAAALPGMVLLVTAGLVYLGTRVPSNRRVLLYAGYVTICAGLNLLGAVLPMKRLGEETAALERDLRQIAAEDGGRAVFVACDDPKAVVNAGVPYLRLRSVWTGTVPEIQERVGSWIQARLRDGERPYLVGRWCFPEEWKTTSSKARFDLFYLERSFTLSPTRLTDVPVTEPVPTNPFSWRRGAVVALAPRSGTH